MKSVAQMLEAIAGLVGTKDVTEWEDKFIRDMYARYFSNGKVTGGFSDAQVTTIERIHEKHFA